MNKLWIVSLLIAWADLVRSECNVPSVKRLNFYDSIEILNGTSRTLSCEIHSDTALHQDLPFSGWKRDYPPYLPTNYSLGNASCSVTPSKICIDSNLTLINVIQSEYDGNYSLTAVNDCGNSTVYVYVNIIVLPKCRNDYSRPPPLKIPPPPIVQAVQGMSVIIKATYVGCYDDPNLLAFWCIVKRDGYYYCFFPSDNNPVCNVTINGCLPPNFDCCNFVVSIEIRSSTLDQSEANLTSIAGWSQQDPYYSVGNSTLIINPYPTLDRTSSNRSVELTEGQFFELKCIYNASINPSVTIPTWKFNDELLEQNSSHYTMITDFGSDPTNPNRVVSKLILSKVIPDNTGTYTCQCAYNSEVVNHEGVTSQASSFYIKVKSGKSYMMDEIIGGVIGGIVVLVVGTLVYIFVVVMLIKVVRRNRPAQSKNKSCTQSDQVNDPTQPLLNVAGDGYGSIQSTDNPNTEDTPLSFDVARSGSTQLTDNLASVDTSSTPLSFDAGNDYGSTQSTDVLISGQDTHPSLKGLTPSHRRPCRQPGDMVTGATNIFGTTTAEIHEQSLAPAKKSNHVSTSLEPFDRTQSRSSDANQPATPDSHVEDIKDRSDKAVPSDKPEISPLPTNEPIESVTEGPRTLSPAAVVRPSDFESRFSFDENLPEPERWRPGPKTYPSQNVKAWQVDNPTTPKSNVAGNGLKDTQRGEDSQTDRPLNQATAHTLPGASDDNSSKKFLSYRPHMQAIKDHVVYKVANIASSLALELGISKKEASDLVKTGDGQIKIFRIWLEKSWRTWKDLLNVLRKMNEHKLADELQDKLQKKVILEEMLAEPPSMYSLRDVIQRVAPFCYDIAVEFGLVEKYLILETNHPNNCALRCRKVFEEFLNLDNPTWKKVIDAIKVLGFNAIAEVVEKKLPEILDKEEIRAASLEHEPLKVDMVVLLLFMQSETPLSDHAIGWLVDLQVDNFTCCSVQ